MSSRGELVVSNQVVEVLPGLPGGHGFRSRGRKVYKPSPYPGD